MSDIGEGMRERIIGLDNGTGNGMKEGRRDTGRRKEMRNGRAILLGIKEGGEKRLRWMQKRECMRKRRQEGAP